MSKTEYFITVPLRPANAFELRACNDGTNRECKIIEVHADQGGSEWAQQIQLPAKIISIAGSRIKNYTFKNILKMLNKADLPVRLRLQNITNSPLYRHNSSHSQNNNNNSHFPQTTSDSESESDNGHYNRPRSASSARNASNKKNNSNSLYQAKRSQYKNKYQKYTKGSAALNKVHKKTHKKTDSNMSNSSIISLNLATFGTHKKCINCPKQLKSSKQHRCRRCGEVVCSKCSKNKRLEVGFDKLLRVCDVCVQRDEFVVEIHKKPLRIQIGAIKSEDDIGGLHIALVKEGGGIREAEIANNVKMEKTIIIYIGDDNIEMSSYKEAIEILRSQNCPFSIRCKRWNKNTKHSAKEQLEKEHQERLAEAKRFDEEEEQRQMYKEHKKKNKKKHSQYNDDSKNNGYDTPTMLTPTGDRKHRRNGTDSSVDMDGGFDSPFESNDTVIGRSGTFRKINPSNLWDGDNVNLERYAGTEEIEDDPAYELIKLAEQCEKEDPEQAAEHYKKAIKQFQQTLNKIDNNKLKRKWRQRINDYELQLLRINRKLKLQRKIKNKNKHARSQTLNPTRKSQKKKASTDYTSDMKNPEEKGDGDGGGGDDDGGGSKKDKKAKDPDAQFRSRLEADIITEKPNVSFKDVQGLTNVKLAIYETVILPQRRPELFTGLREPAMGLLLFGPPGNGKTMIAKCIATGIESTFFSISASSITSKYVGEAERIMRTLFTVAREKSPSIIFIDEIDSLLTARGGKNEAESSRRIKTEFLVQFDGVKGEKDAKSSILVIGATNLPDQLDEAVLRRFAKRILVPQPEYDTRYGLIRNMMRDEPHCMTEEDFVKIGKATERYSCSDIAHLCRDAALGPLREMGAVLADDDEFDYDSLPKTNIQHFQASLSNVRSSLSKESLIHYKIWDKKFGSKFSLSAKQLPPFLQSNPIEPLD